MIQLEHEKEYEALFMIRDLANLLSEMMLSERMNKIGKLAETLLLEISEDKCQ